MLLNKSGSYYEEYRRSKRDAPGPGGPGGSGKSTRLEDERLLTDRSAYITFLETQLERVSAACLTSQSYGDRIEEVQATVLTSQEKVNNLGRAVKLAETSGKHQASESVALVRSVERKLEGFETDVHSVRLQSQHTSHLVDGLRVEMDAFEARAKELTDEIRRRVEQRVLEFGGRLELQEARGKSNESRLVGLSDVTREETKGALEAAQGMADVKLEQQHLRLSALEARVSNALEHFKTFPALQAGGPRDENWRSTANPTVNPTVNPTANPTAGFEAEHVRLRFELEETRREINDRNDIGLKRIMQSLRELEGKVATAVLAASEQPKLQQLVAKLARRVDHLHLRMEEADKESGDARREGKALRARVKRLEEQLGFGGFGGIGAEEPVLSRAAVRKLAAEAAEVYARRVQQPTMEAVEKKLKEQNTLVAESMAKVEGFMDIFDVTQAALRDRLAHGQEHQQRLATLLEQSAAALDAEAEAEGQTGGGVRADFGADGGGASSEAGSASAKSPFRLAYEDLSSIVQDMARHGAALPAGPGRSATSKAMGARPRRRERKPGPSAATSAATSSSAAAAAGFGGKAEKKRTKKSKRGLAKERRRSLSAERPKVRLAGTSLHEKSTISSATRRRSKTPPPHRAGLGAGDWAGSDRDDGALTDSSLSRARDGGGKRGRSVSASSVKGEGAAQADKTAEQVEPLLAASTARAAGSRLGSASAGEEEARPPWNAPVTHPLSQGSGSGGDVGGGGGGARPSAASTSSLSSLSSSGSSGSAAAAQDRKRRLRQLYKELSK